ncbi:MAG: shikimate kinase [Gammaproteobacteria bacterium]|tara:strand:+ start:52 stop:561 length:510 start_codon:yes stop_codon:yes gene_type:complete
MDLKNIFIVGAMGSGKSSVGRLFAQRCQKQFLDTDHEIENDSKLDIATIFEKYGEEEFRKKETKLLEDLSGLENHIIATGGGIILKQENIDIMKKMGLIVFLDIDLKTQIQRVKYRKHRPLLKKTDLEKRLKILKSERDPIYNTISDYIIDVSTKDKKTVVEEIKNKLL